MNPDEYEDLDDDTSDDVLDDMFVEQYEVDLMINNIEPVKQYRRGRYDDEYT